VIGAQTGHSREFGQAQPIIEVRLDVVLYAVEPIAG
jgi:hypothetical protein